MFLEADYNPFQGRTLHATEEFHKFLSENSKTQGEDKRGGAGKVPFVRMIDGWLLSAALGAKYVDLGADLVESKARNFAQGSVLQRDPGAIEFMMLLAIGITCDPKIVSDPIRVTKIVWQAAEAGFPTLKAMTETGGLMLTENISTALAKSAKAEVASYQPSTSM